MKTLRKKAELLVGGLTMMKMGIQTESAIARWTMNLLLMSRVFMESPMYVMK